MMPEPEYEIVYAWNIKMGKHKLKTIMSPHKGILTDNHWSLPTPYRKNPSYNWFIPYDENDKLQLTLCTPISEINIDLTKEKAVERFNKALNDCLETILTNAQNLLRNYIGKDTQTVHTAIENIKHSLD